MKVEVVENGRLTGFTIGRIQDGGRIRCLFTTRNASSNGGVLDFDHRKTDDRIIDLSYRAAADWFGVATSSIFVMRQVHGGDVVVLDEHPDADRVYAVIPVDAAVTDRAGLVLTVLTADCLPILISDRRRGVIAAVHAGWRSSVAGIVGKVIRTMIDRFGSRPTDIAAVLGPAIGPCCFEVGGEVVAAAADAFEFAREYIRMKPDGKGMLDLVGLNRAVIEEAGVPAAGILSLDMCTYCREDLFYSYRREGAGTGRMLSGIVITPSVDTGHPGRAR